MDSGLKCHWVKHEGQRILIPGCWSRVIYGDNAPCNCKKESEISNIEKLEKRIEKLENKIKLLTQTLNK